MTTTVYRDGYLDGDYLSGDYLDGAADAYTGFQVQMIVRDQMVTGQQVQMVIHQDVALGQQVEMIVYKETPIGQQALMLTIDSAVIGMSVDQAIGNAPTVGHQVEAVVNDDAPIGQQAEMVTAAQPVTGSQVEATIQDRTQSFGMSARIDTLRHALCESYLVDSYLSGPYLSGCMHAFMGMQVEMRPLVQSDYGMQVEGVIKDTKNIGQQAEMVVYTETPRGQQVQLVQVARYGQQATMVIYNNTQLRILQQFDSRGTAALGGDNWTASNQAVGDFEPKNLNTDVEEQVFRSSTTAVELVCDTGVPQGVTLDTIAIINHNMTRDAQVQVQGSNSPTFDTINVSFDMVAETERMYYIAPTYPTGIENQNRYWRFVISDANNSDGYIQIGIIVFGNSDIFTPKESFDNPINKGYKHFKDELKTEGFTAANNDRALRRYLKLRFSEQERIHGNFKMIEDYVNFARTSLKCLIIPIPLYASRYAVFAKLVTMPDFEIRNVSNIDDPDGRAEYVNYNLDWDESL